MQSIFTGLINISAVIHRIHIVDQIQHLVGIAPLVVIPGNELHEPVIQHDASLCGMHHQRPEPE